VGREEGGGEKSKAAGGTHARELAGGPFGVKDRDGVRWPSAGCGCVRVAKVMCQRMFEVMALTTTVPLPGIRSLIFCKSL
jgi:hypothetical protein